MDRAHPFSRFPLKGSRITLTELQESDLSELAFFFRDMESLVYYIPTTARPLNHTQVRRLLDDWNDGVHHFVFAIRKQEHLVGILNLDGLDWPNSHTELGIAITSPEARGQGYALEALSLVIDYAFGELGLHRIWARVIEDNIRSLHLFERLGFKKEGRLREHVLRHGAYRDMVFISLLSREWSNPM
jgi:RimJ/RimL family protein N-acetyltransferase